MNLGKIMKIKINENFTSIMNHINDLETTVKWFDLVQYTIDYDMYEELYKHHFIFEHLIQEHNQSIKDHTWVKPV